VAKENWRLASIQKILNGRGKKLRFSKILMLPELERSLAMDGKCAHILSLSAIESFQLRECSEVVAHLEFECLLLIEA
jgi:hypothetical protein